MNTTKPNLYKSIHQKYTMGTALIKIKIMPDSPDADLDAIEEKAKQIISEEKGENLKFEREPVAFGLNAIIVGMSREEGLSSDEMLEKLQNSGNVSSAEIIDFRRAFG